MKGVLPGGVQFKGFLDERGFDWIWCFRFTSAVIQISQRGSNWQDTLFQAAIEAFEGFLAEIADIVGRNNSLNIGR